MGALRYNFDLIFANLLFGANFSFYVSLTRNYLDFQQIFMLQVLAASIFFIPFALFSKQSYRIPLRDFGNILIVTVLIVYGWMFMLLWGASYTSPIDASTISTLGPVFTILTGHFLLREKNITWARRIGEELVQFDFRNKSKFGWAAAKETIYTNSKQYDSDEYAKLFYGHNMIRPSCYKCLYRGLNRVSDITLGDAWGVGEADFFDEKGISLVLVNSNRGEKMMEDVDLYVRKVDIQNYMQPALTESFKEPADRNAFWRKYHSSDILDVMLFENGTGLFKVKRYVRKAAYQLFRRLGKNDENLSK